MPWQRLKNDHSFTCATLRGKELESFSGYYTEGSQSEILMLVLKVKGSRMYQRFFLDTGIGVWEEWERDEVFADLEELSSIDIAGEHKLGGKTIKNIFCGGSYEELSYLTFDIGNTRVVLMYEEGGDREPETVLRVTLPFSR
jgi:hypothetical protein